MIYNFFVIWIYLRQSAFIGGYTLDGDYMKAMCGIVQTILK